MFTTASSPTLTTTTSPTSPTRPSRLRGLSYLRNYTHNHLHSRESSASSTGSTSRPNILRATSYPSPTPTPIARSGTDVTPTPRSPAPQEQQRSNIELGPSSPVLESPVVGTSGWLPTVGGQSAVSPVPFSPAQPAATSIPSATLATSVEETPLATAMGRTRSATTSRANEMANERHPASQFGSVPTQSVLSSQSQPSTSSLPSIRFSQHQDARAPRPSLIFSPMQRTLPTAKDVIRVGRYSEREQIPNQPYNVPSAAPVGFKSKVVSRRHCEFWSQDGTWYIRDVKSSSGTFLNHVRLSSPGQESKPFAVKDGDIVQLGIDFKGGEEMIFRCVKIRVELNRNWQNSLNTFNVASHKRLRKMAQQNSSQPGSSSQDCSICLGPVAPCQALFVAPCSHTWHYKCVRRILNGPLWPQFICPNCRAVADLEAEVDEPYDDGDWEEIDDPSDSQLPAQTPAATEPAHTQIDEHQAQTSADVASRGSMGVAEDEMMLDEEVEHHSRSSAPELSTDESDEELVATQAALQAMHLHFDPPQSQSQAQGQSSFQSGSASATIPIPIPSASSRNASLDERCHGHGGVRTPSPNSSLSASSRRPVAAGDLSQQQRRLGSGNGQGEAPVLGEGPMTPRNDAGPFVFDGSAGRSASVDASNPAGRMRRAMTATEGEGEHEREGHPL